MKQMNNYLVILHYTSIPIEMENGSNLKSLVYLIETHIEKNKDEGHGAVHFPIYFPIREPKWKEFSDSVISELRKKGYHVTDVMKYTEGINEIFISWDENVTARAFFETGYSFGPYVPKVIPS
jgi:hypothetical protein